MKRSIRDRAVNALRTTTARQIKVELSDAYGGRCANGVICDGLGIPVADTADWGAAYETLDNLGFPVASIWGMNDQIFGQRTFAEIADWIEANVPVEDDWPPDYVPAGWVAEMAVTG